MFHRDINAPAAEVYRAFTLSMALQEWLCETARVVAVKGGRVYLEWASGYFTYGEYITLIPARKVAFSWFGRGEPATTTVQVTLREKNGCTRVSLQHSGVGTGKAWLHTVNEFATGWEVLLENLQSVMESGIDLRIAKRPMLGISFGEPLTKEKVVELKAPSTDGIRITGIVEGMGAHNAGLRVDDVIVSLDGRKLAGYPALAGAMQRRRGGDRVKIGYYRAGRKHAVSLELSPRQLPNIPINPLELTDAVRNMYSHGQALLRRCLEGIPEVRASRRPSLDQWSVCDILAHLIATERDLLGWVASVIEEDEVMNVFRGNIPARLQSIVQVYGTAQALFDELVSNQTEVVALFEALPDNLLTHRSTLWRLGYRVLNLDSHTEEHVKQITMALQAVP